MNSNKAAKDNISDIYDDGILDFSKDSLRYHIKGLSINSPFTMQGETNYTKQDEVSSPTNAQPTTPLNQPVVAANDQVTTPKGTIVDSESGAVLEGESTSPTQSSTDVKPIIDSVVANSKIIQLSEDGKYYINTRTGKKYARVTSIIQADEHSDGRFDPNSPWVTPSTNIGTGIDELVRDFFAGKLKDNYPNIGKNQIDLFVSQLQGLKNSLDAQGLTVVPRDVVATGSIEVTDSEGKKHTIDVAGTLDLLAYDGKGNFYIFDMKTHRSANVDGKIDKWRRQLTLYKTFLESQYGIKVKSLNIIPIKVEYPTPKGVGNSTNEFTVKEGNQLLLNGKEFTGANPNLDMTIALNPIELNVLFDNLTEEEKSQIRESEASQSEVGTIEKVDTKEEGGGFFVEPITGLWKAESKDCRRKKKSKGGAVKKPVERLTLVPAKYQWGKFEGATTSDGDTIDAKLVTSNLEKAGYTEESWNQLSDEEMQHELDCKGV